jgi:drug/metabolite transporter (DMT)-like permease
MVAAVLLWSLSGLFAKSAAFSDWPAEHRGLLLGFWRAAFAGLLLLPFARQIRWKWSLVPMSLSFAVMNASYLSAMVLTTAANAIWLQATAPLWVLLFCIAGGRSRVRRMDLVFAALCVGGMAIILSREITHAQPAGVIMGLVAGISFAGVIMWLRALRLENGIWLVVVNQLVSVAAVLPLILWQAAWRTPDVYQLGILAAFGLFQIGIPYLLFAHALRSISSLEASALSLLEPILAPVWVAIFRDEFPAAQTIAGAALILVGLAVRLTRPDDRP